MNLTHLQAAIEQGFPIDAPLVSFHTVPPDHDQTSTIWQDPAGNILITFRLIRWDSEPRLVRDIIQQELIIIRDRHLDQPEDRLVAYLRGWINALGHVARRPSDVDMLWPGDLVHPRVLELVRPATPEQFAAAFGRKSRVGRFIQPEDTP